MRMKITTYVAVLIHLTAVTVLGSGGVLAQTDVDRGKVRNAIEVTDEVIAKAEVVILESRSQKGRLKLAQAKSIQDRAKASFDSNANSMAFSLTMQAREEAYQAMAMARIETNTEARLTRLVEEITERLARVRDLMIENGLIAERVMKLVDEARNLLEKSRINAHQYRYQLAVKLAESARQRSIQAEQEARRTRALKEMTERRLVLMENLMERARERVKETQNGQAERQLRLAGEQLEKAKQLQRDGRYQAARVMIEKCEKTFRGLIRRFHIQAESDPDALLEETYRLLARAQELVSSGGKTADPKRAELMERVKALITTAEAATAAGNTAQARRMLTEARVLLRSMIKEQREDVSRESVTSLIRRIESLQEEVRAVIQSCTAPGVETLMERAAHHLENAATLADEGNLSGASAEAKIAENIYNRIREICSI